MDVKQYNEDKQVPWTKETPGAVVHTPSFKDQIHIFWGPNQPTVKDVDYTPPDPKAWHSLEPLNIPQVIRFIYAADDAYETDGFPKPGGGGGGINISYEVTKLTDHVEPFPNDCMVYVQRSINGIPDGPLIAYSSRKSVVDYANGNAILPVFAKFSVGMQYTLIFPATNPIDYRYQSADGAAQGDGFYTRYQGIKVGTS